jgi:hypothetical protein
MRIQAFGIIASEAIIINYSGKKLATQTSSVELAVLAVENLPG